METIERHKHVSRTLVYTWHKRFKKGWTGDPMKEARGRPSKSDDKLKSRVLDVIREDRRLTVREVGDMIGVGKSSVQRILSDLSMTRVCARWVHRLLTEEQMQCRLSSSNEFLKFCFDESKPTPL